ncbi:hypothetical protein ACWD6P_22785 [Streptomyces sp. NPDC002446]
MRTSRTGCRVGTAVITSAVAVVALQALTAPSAAAARPDAAQTELDTAVTRNTSDAICIPTLHRGD